MTTSSTSYLIGRRSIASDYPKLTYAIQVDMVDLPSFGLIQITKVGVENVYFESKGKEYFYKA